MVERACRLLREAQTGAAIIEVILGTDDMPVPPHQPQISAGLYVLSGMAALAQVALWWWIGDIMLGLLRSVL